jgi:hypothetical protein
MTATSDTPDFAEEAAIIEGILRMHSEEIEALSLRAALGEVITSDDVLKAIRVYA